MGSKISVFIIVIAMVVLAGVLGDSPYVLDESKSVTEKLKTYTEIEENKAKPKEFLFENYTIEGGRYVGSISEVDFSTSPLAINFKEIIELSVESIGVNYAGKYSVATWSCGNECQNSAIINVESGAIHTYGIISAYGLSFSPESTLLIINPEENLLPGHSSRIVVETDYYSVTNEKLEFQGKRVGQKDVVEDCIQAITNARNKITNEVIEFGTPCTVPFGWELIQ